MKRERRVAEDGTIYYNVVYPKFKVGDEVVREVAVQPTYGESLFTTLQILLELSLQQGVLHYYTLL